MEDHDWQEIERDILGDRDFKCSKCDKIASQHPLVFEEHCPGPDKKYGK